MAKISKQTGLIIVRNWLNNKYNPYRKRGGWNKRVVKAIVKEAGLDPDLVHVSDMGLLFIGCTIGLIDRGADAAGIYEFCLWLKTLPEYQNNII